MAGDMQRQQSGTQGKMTGAGQQTTWTEGGQGAFPVDNPTYNLISALHTKLEGLAAYRKYFQDAQGDQECQQLFQQLHQQDYQAAQLIQQQLQKHFEQQGAGRGH
jgi:hypothetical protein